MGVRTPAEALVRYGELRARQDERWFRLPVGYWSGNPTPEQAGLIVESMRIMAKFGAGPPERVAVARLIRQWRRERRERTANRADRGGQS